MPAILVVDDDPLVRTLTRYSLEPEGHEIEEASSAADGIEAVQRRMPDLILLDIVMPDKDGWRFLDELRSRGLRDRTRVVMMSSHSGSENRARSRTAGAIAFVAKPFDPEELCRVVAAALDRSLEDLRKEHERMGELALLMQTLDSLDD